MLKGDKMQIKNLDFNDYMLYRSEIRELLIDSYGDEFNISQEKIALLIDEKLEGLDGYIKKNAFIIGAISDGHLLAFAWIYQYNENGQERFHFKEAAVNINYRRRGIGKKLAEKAIEIVKETEVKIIDSIVSEENVISRKLSEEQGFTTHKRYLVKRLKK